MVRSGKVKCELSVGFGLAWSEADRRFVSRVWFGSSRRNGHAGTGTARSVKWVWSGLKGNGLSIRSGLAQQVKWGGWRESGLSVRSGQEGIGQDKRVKREENGSEWCGGSSRPG